MLNKDMKHEERQTRENDSVEVTEAIVRDREQDRMKSKGDEWRSDKRITGEAR